MTDVANRQGKASMTDQLILHDSERSTSIDAPLLLVEDLQTYFYTRAGVVKAVEGVSFHLGKGKTLGIVGESGSGKSVTALSIMRLIPQPPGRFVNGRVAFKGTPILDVRNEVVEDGRLRVIDSSVGEGRMRQIRGGDISMIFQDPMTSLNPLLKIGLQLAEVVQEHLGLGRKAAYDRAAEMLEKVGIPAPNKRLDDYPHQFSGGMRQRVMIAMALSTNPDLLIADEPTTALDVTIQAQILDLIRGLSQEFGTSVILITHDMGVVANMADQVAVMYAGHVVEAGEIQAMFYRPRHPYTNALLQSIPKLEGDRSEPLTAIPGSPPDLLLLGPGCPFAPRCPNVQDICRLEMPPLKPVERDHLAACWNPVRGTSA
jgi:oligopeptide/dipeptide ABC transporter ATP-binding protein